MLFPRLLKDFRKAVVQNEADTGARDGRVMIEIPEESTSYMAQALARRRGRAYLAQAQRLSRTGSFGWNVSTDEHHWSDETFRIFEFAPMTTVSLTAILGRVHPEDLPAADMAIAAANRGEGIDLELRLLMPD